MHIVYNIEKKRKKKENGELWNFEKVYTGVNDISKVLKAAQNRMLAKI